jgi:Protein of unknown function (DUF3489)
MKTFVVDSANNVSVRRSHAAVVPGRKSKFASEKELPKVAANWPTARLVEIWNQLPGVRPVRKFTDRKTAVRRIWQAIQNLEPAGTKTDRILALLEQPAGATLEALRAVTGWQPHSVRGFLSQLSKSRGLQIESFKREGQRVYRIVQNPPARKARRKERA